MDNEQIPLNEEVIKSNQKHRPTNRVSMDDMFKTRDSTNYPAVSRNKQFNSTKPISVISNLMKSSSGFTRTVITNILKSS